MCLLIKLKMSQKLDLAAKILRIKLLLDDRKNKHTEERK